MLLPWSACHLIYPKVNNLNAFLNLLIKNVHEQGPSMQQPEPAGRSRTVVSSRYTCSRCHLLFSSCRLSLTRSSPPPLSQCCIASHPGRKENKLAPKNTRPHTGIRLLRDRNNSQKPPSCTCARGQGHPSKRFREISASFVVEMPSPFAVRFAPKYSPERPSHTKWSVLVLPS